jgi:hypothetical protein
MAVTVQRREDKIVITVPSTVDPTEVQLILDQIRFTDIVNRSQATDDDIKSLSRSVNKAMSKEILEKLKELEEFKDIKL